jgi:hypothetical protein
MPKYVIERDVAGAGQMTAEQLTALSQKSCAVLADLGPRIQWIHSYVTDDKIYCVYLAPDEQMVLQHARQGGFPADVVARVHTMIEPVTAEMVTASV